MLTLIWLAMVLGDDAKKCVMVLNRLLGECAIEESEYFLLLGSVIDSCRKPMFIPYDDGVSFPSVTWVCNDSRCNGVCGDEFMNEFLDRM